MTDLSSLVLPLLQRLPPESAHSLAMAWLQHGWTRPGAAADRMLAVEVAGLRLPSPIGLAAGFDKDARATAGLLQLGFGFVEAGTATPKPQAGNPRPRLFRLAEDRALINRMGFNNAGLPQFLERLAARNRALGVIGANVGANKDSTDRIADYVHGCEQVWPLADYIAINVSSPNTPGLRGLQEQGALEELLGRVAQARPGRDKPLLLKIAPDLADGAVAGLVETAVRHGVDGLIVANTTIARPPGLRGRHAGQTGGLSGRPLRERAVALLRLVVQAAAGRLAIISVGGGESAHDVLERLRAGAGAVQLYTAFVYEGAALPQRLNADLADVLRAEGHASAAAAIGTAV